MPSSPRPLVVGRAAMAAIVGLMAFFAAATPAADATPSGPESLTSPFTAQMEKRHIPGAAVAVVKDGRLAWAQGYGLADIKKELPAGTQTRFPIGSMTKPFTATAVMMLAGEGRIDLEAPVSTYLPALPESYAGVTVRQMLNHTSGVPRDFKRPGRSLVDKELFTALAKTPPDFPPGERINYSNTGFILLGMLIEEVTGHPWHEFLETRIFAPLSMDSTAYIDRKVKKEPRATGYEWNGERLVPLSGPPERFAAGSLISTAEDLAKWAIALHEGSLLPRETLAAMWAPQSLSSGERATYGKTPWEMPLDAGLGWFAGESPRGRAVHHGGATDGYSSELDLYLDHETAIIVLCNNEQGQAVDLAQVVAQVEIPLAGAPD